MKRYRIFREGVPTEETTPRMITPRGVQIPDVVPVLNRPKGKQIGRLTHVRREAGGWVTGVPEGFVLLKGFGLASAIEMDEDADQQSVVGELVACHVTKGAAWPGMVEK